MLASKERGGKKTKVAGRQRFFFAPRFLPCSLPSANSPTAAATRRFRGLEVIRSAAEAAAAAAAAAPTAGRRDCRAISSSREVETLFFLLAREGSPAFERLSLLVSTFSAHDKQQQGRRARPAGVQEKEENGATREEQGGDGSRLEKVCGDDRKRSDEEPFFFFDGKIETSTSTFEREEVDPFSALDAFLLGKMRKERTGNCEEKERERERGLFVTL